MTSSTNIPSKEEEWRYLQVEIRKCYKCSLHTQGVFPVFGDGSLNSKVVFIGEAPGFKENQLKRPFVGKSGQILNEFLGKINLSRDTVFISNIIKCRPPNNRDPSSEEIASCAPFLSQQMKLLSAKIVVTLGRFSTKFFHEEFTSMSEIVGKIIQKDEFYLLPMFHPATCLYHPQKYRPLFERDFYVLKNILKDKTGIFQENKLDEEGSKESVGLDRFINNI
ncbi:MAG: uracil-DNA glycosylase [Candidatus Hodarchaeales archaeon]